VLEFLFLTLCVIPVKTGIQKSLLNKYRWIPAFAGMTAKSSLYHVG